MRLQTPKGFRDFLPEDALKRKFVLGKIVEVFEKFGFDPLETPTLEYEETLTGKYGEEEKLIYKFETNGGDKVALKYDQTVPLARVVAQYGSRGEQKLPAPFKRYQIQSAFRGENTQKGRYREFLQCDADIVGVSTPLADAEILALVYEIYKNLGLDVILAINDRQLLNGIEPKYLSALDKLEKIGPDGVKDELVTKGLDPQAAAELYNKVARFSNRVDKVIDKSTRRETQIKITRFNRFIDERQGEGAAPPSQRSRIKQMMMDAALDGESVTVINWICPPGTPLRLDSSTGTLYRSFVGIDPEEGFNKDYRLVDRLDRESALVKALDDSGVPYRYVKLVADDNAFCLYPAGLKINGIQPTMDAVADFAAYAQKRLDTEIGTNKIEVMTVSQALGPKRFADLVKTYKTTSIQDLLPFLPPNTVETGLDVVRKHTQVDPELLPYFKQFVEDGIKQYGVEGSSTFLDQVFGPRIILAWNESTRRTAIIDSLRKAQGFDPLPKIFTLYNKVNGQIVKNY